MTENTIRSVDEVSREAHTKWLSKADKANASMGEMTVLPYGYLSQAIEEAITQDRQALLDAVCGVLEGMKRDTEIAKVVSDEYILWCATYNQALSDAQTAIKNLLDVNK